MSWQELANKTCRTESKNWEGFSGTASKNWKVFRKCVCVSRPVLTHVKNLLHVSPMWNACATHDACKVVVRHTSKYCYNCKESPNQSVWNVQHSASWMQLHESLSWRWQHLRGYTIWLFDAIWPENCKKCLQSCWKIKLSIQTLMQTTLYIVQTTLQTALYIMQTTLYIMQTTLCHNANYIMP